MCLSHKKQFLPTMPFAISTTAIFGLLTIGFVAALRMSNFLFLFIWATYALEGSPRLANVASRYCTMWFPRVAFDACCNTSRVLHVARQSKTVVIISSLRPVVVMN
ncbi:uncharacterized protein BCR38DRAFT_9848 [Pseudomassariella vexata]|uniref:Uncharacterized protein n=1 Tax=Pseudomassariella vexata TaxID=1141098 RepID=A0A1Y2EJA7_9PEZI|nr:uncharacterized protein BCR38DRAFT_9848 [Pseudomassariella vexata]ORY71404.1 hypothetical protein BCR38DRAFT_9848 [Pseudomassariella vexata]